MTMAANPSSSEREQRLEQVLADYLHAVEAGTPPDRDEMLRRHPELAGDLASFFRNRDAVERLAEPLRQGPSQDATVGATGPAVGSMVRYFGDYELLEEVARGGMGVVYRARQVSLERVVALKMILAGQLASAADVARFHREAQTAANLRHPSIVAIHEVGEHDGQHYFSMDFIDGSSLADRLRRQPLPPAEAAALLVVVARAIGHAHRHGVLHRDIKPSNILIDRDGRPLVSDFGLARRQSDEGLTASGAILGTPGYVAPEQARGDTRGVGPASDVYSLGAVLYECVTGRPPFQAATPLDTILQSLESDPVPPRLLNRAVSRDLETLILQCLAHQPRRRYPSADDLANDLERWLRNEPIRARRVGWLEQAVLWARRRPAQAALAAVSLAAALALAVVVSVYSVRLGEKAVALRQAEEQIGRREQEVTALDRQVRRQIDRAELHLGELYASKGYQRVEQGDWSAALLFFAHAAQADGNDPDRLAAHRLRYRAHLPRGVRLLDVIDFPEQPAGPTGKDKGSLADRPWARWGTGGPWSDPLETTTPGGRFRARAYNRGDGPWPKFVAVVEDTAAGKEVLRHDLEQSDPVHLSLSDDGRWFVLWWEESGSAGTATAATVVETATGRPFAPLAKVRLRQAWVSPDGSRLLAVEAPPKGGKPVTRLWDTGTGKPLPVEMPLPDALRSGPATVFGAGGTLLLTHDGEVTVYDTTSGKARLPAPLRDGGAVEAVAVSPDGRRAALLTNDGASVWDLALGSRLGPRLPRPCRPRWGNRGFVAFSPSGTQLLVMEKGGVGEATCLWQLGPPERVRRTASAPGPWTAPAGWWCSWKGSTRKCATGPRADSLPGFPCRPLTRPSGPFSGRGSIRPGRSWPCGTGGWRSRTTRPGRQPERSQLWSMPWPAPSQSARRWCMSWPSRNWPSGPAAGTWQRSAHRRSSWAVCSRRWLPGPGPGDSACGTWPPASNGCWRRAPRSRSSTTRSPSGPTDGSCSSELPKGGPSGTCPQGKRWPGCRRTLVTPSSALPGSWP
jgi:hypothetical protein